MKKVIERPQISDMGSGFGSYQFSKNYTLREFLDYYKNTNKTWGTITIFHDNKVVRKFDYNIYDNNQFYHHLTGVEYNMIVKGVNFSYCFMSEDVSVYV